MACMLISTGAIIGLVLQVRWRCRRLVDDKSTAGILEVWQVLIERLPPYSGLCSGGEVYNELPVPPCVLRLPSANSSSAVLSFRSSARSVSTDKSFLLFFSLSFSGTGIGHVQNARRGGEIYQNRFFGITQQFNKTDHQTS